MLDRLTVLVLAALQVCALLIRCPLGRQVGRAGGQGSLGQQIAILDALAAGAY
jgi:hypothetical protein